mgnify:CR=1 FL=1
MWRSASWTHKNRGLLGNLLSPAFKRAAEYAATGVDGLATTALFTAKPLDMSVRMEPTG